MRAAVVRRSARRRSRADVDEPVRGDGTARSWRSRPRRSTPWRSASPPAAIRVVREPPYVPGLEGAGTVIESDRARARHARPLREPRRLPGFGVAGNARGARGGARRSRWSSCPTTSTADLAAAVGVVGITALLALERAAPVERRARAGARGHRRRRADGRPARQGDGRRPASWAPAERRAPRARARAGRRRGRGARSAATSRRRFERRRRRAARRRDRSALGRAGDGGARARSRPRAAS